MWLLVDLKTSLVHEPDSPLAPSYTVVESTLSFSRANTTTSEKAKGRPQVRFLGLLDTVKSVNGDMGHLSTFLFHDSVFHIRHALALNETRRHFKPEIYRPVSDYDLVQGRSLIQAWFVGAHADIGGGTRDDGLSLYPLQWLLIESKHFGLALEHSSQAGLIEDPVRLVLPAEGRDSASSGATASIKSWDYQYDNGIKVQMFDLRASHNHGNLQVLETKQSGNPIPNPKVGDTRRSMTPKFSLPKRKGKEGTIKQDDSEKRESTGNSRGKITGAFERFFKKNNTVEVLSSPEDTEGMKDDTDTEVSHAVRHIVRLNHGFLHGFTPAAREPFKDCKLRGYCEGGNGIYQDSHPLSCSTIVTSTPGNFGTIIHPSVYFMMDVYARIEKAMTRFQKDIISFRANNTPIVETLG